MVTIQSADWIRDREAIQRVRKSVFVDEQGVPADIEVDGLDESCVHVLALEDDRPVGTARMQNDGHIGRVSVLKKCRGRGIGRKLLDEMVEQAEVRGLEEVYLNSQVQASSFYEKAGFKKSGPEFYEANMPHVRMTRTLDTG